jgi:hypothetical protein
MVVHDGRLFLPVFATAWAQVLEHALGMGHEGMQKTLQQLHATFFTLGNNKLMRDFIRGCSVYQCNKIEHLHLVGLLQLLDMTRIVWSDVAMDFVEGFPKVGSRSVILTIVNCFPMYAHFIPSGTRTRPQQWARPSLTTLYASTGFHHRS